jgi:hypothetical protein
MKIKEKGFLDGPFFEWGCNSRRRQRRNRTNHFCHIQTEFEQMLLIATGTRGHFGTQFYREDRPFLPVVQVFGFK